MAIGTTAALLGGAGLAASLIGSNKQANAIKDASSAQQAAAAQAASQEERMYLQNREDQMPWMQAGQQALGRLSDLTGTSTNTGAQGFGSLLKPFGMEDFQADPGYEFRMSEGLKALDRSASSKGNVFSGAAGKALTRFGQGMGAQEYQAAYDRYNNDNTNIYNRLAGLSGTGQTTANNLATQGSNSTARLNELMTGAANSQAAGMIGTANAWNSGLQGAANSLAGIYKPKPSIYWQN